MKIWTMVLCLSFFSSAYASSQTNCSNADASVIYATNASGKKLIVTFEEENSAGEFVLVKKELKAFSAKEVMETKIESSSSSTCGQTQSNTGVLSSKDLVFRRITFSKTDGNDLPATIIGVSKDLKTLTVDYLCETNQSSVVICN